MRRFLLVALLGLAFAACNQDQEHRSTVTPTPAVTSTPTLPPLTLSIPPQPAQSAIDFAAYYKLDDQPVAPAAPQYSLPLDQGGTLENLMQGIWQHPSHSPHNRFSTVVVLASANALANPTTPASAVDDRRPLVAPSTVPAGLRPLADAGGSQVPSAPTRPPARRGWSAYADDSGRSEFPLEPPSFAPRWWAAAPPAIVGDVTVARPAKRPSYAVPEAWEVASR